MRGLRTFAVALAGVGLASASAQEPQRPPLGTPRPPVFRGGLDLVNVTVTALDRSGHLVRDLAQEEFQIFDEGRPQKILVFGQAEEPGQDELLALDLGMLMDTSESMLKELKLSQQAALRFLDAIPRARDLLTVFFDQDILISRYDSEHQQGLIDRIGSAKGKGNTALYDAIVVYLSRVEESTGRKVMVLFTDGEENYSSTSLGDVMRLVRSSGVTIYPIAFGSSTRRGGTRATLARAFLGELAETTGGEVFQPATPRDLPQIYTKILDQLRAQYVLGFLPDSPARDGRFRRLKVEVVRPELRLRHREGYHAPGGKAPGGKSKD